MVLSKNKNNRVIRTAFSQPSKLVSTILACCFVVIFGALGVHLLTESHAATPKFGSSALALCPAVFPAGVDPATISCRPFLGASAAGNPGAPGGATSGPTSQFPYLERLIGGTSFHFDMYRDYVCAFSTSPNRTLICQTNPPNKTETNFANAGTDLSMIWNPTQEWSLANGSNSTVNNDIAAAAKKIGALRATVFLSLWHETNLHVDPTSGTCGGSPPGQPTAGTAKDFVLAWQNVHKIFVQQGVKNVVWVMNYSNINENKFTCNVVALWPGDAYVDWVTFDTYSRGKSFQNTAGSFYTALANWSYTSENNDVNALGQHDDFLKYPWGIGEFGTCRQPAGISEPAYFQTMQQAVAANAYPRLHWYVIYANTANTAGTTGTGCLTNYLSDGTPSAAKQQAVNSVFTTLAGGGSGGSPSPTIALNTPLSGATVSGKTVSVKATAKVATGATIKSISLTAGGMSLGTCNGLSGTIANCSKPWDTTTLSNGAKSITATTTASDNKTGSTSRNVTVNNQLPPPSSPTNITSPSQTTTTIKLSWSPSSDANYSPSQLTYQIYRDGGSKPIGSTAAGVTMYTDKNLAPGTYYTAQYWQRQTARPEASNRHRHHKNN